MQLSTDCPAIDTCKIDYVSLWPSLDVIYHLHGASSLRFPRLKGRTQRSLSRRIILILPSHSMILSFLLEDPI